MTALCLLKLLRQATRKENRFTRSLCGAILAETPQRRILSEPSLVVPDSTKPPVLGATNPFCTAVKSGADPKRKAAFGSVGRRIPYRILHVINENGESLGNMHRAEALKLMDQHNLKLVLLRESAEPPVYRLMTGKQIHEEQLRRAEKKKASAKAEQVRKELSFSSSIARNDLETKTKQIAQWIEKKYHVKVTVRQAKDSAADMFTVFDQILKTVSEKATYLSKPKVIKEGVSTCVLRHMSEKELKAQQKLEKQKLENSIPVARKDENEAPKSSELNQ
ncbi:translation initiation factor IF-3, mitochondrial [Nothoprocta perdicaria]|uniref:translation initiation factor IF-3, mitochondrial n=1 Tax=Nothoprocta perdicaria TaxID=30464 RepID=UPI000E1B7CFC|nr:translation initiation factor IF-3, mitochondrial [Nothoprocta perdicaria]